VQREKGKVEIAERKKLGDCPNFALFPLPFALLLRCFVQFLFNRFKFGQHFFHVSRRLPIDKIIIALTDSVALVGSIVTHENDGRLQAGQEG